MLSSILYAFFSYTPVLEEWLEDHPQRSHNEEAMLARFALARRELVACRGQATIDRNEPALEIIERAFEVCDLHDRSILDRLMWQEPR